MSRCNITIASLILSCILAIAAPAISSAHQGAKGIVKQRMDIMTSVAQNLKTVLQMIRKQKPFDAAAAAKAANAIAAHAKEFSGKFPKGTHGHPSEAKATIWMEKSRFNRQSAQMGTYAKALAAAARQAAEPSSLIPEFKKLAATCSACHRTYRLKKR